MERLRQDRECVLEEARLQQEQRVAEQAAGEEQRSRMEALEERVAQLAGRLCEAPAARKEECPAHRQASPEQQGQGRTYKRSRRCTEHPGDPVEQLQELRPAQCRAAVRAAERVVDVPHRAFKRLRQGEGSSTERRMPQREQPGATLAPTAPREGRTAEALLQPPQLGALFAPNQPMTPARLPSPPLTVLPS